MRRHMAWQLALALGLFACGGDKTAGGSGSGGSTTTGGVRATDGKNGGAGGNGDAGGNAGSTGSNPRDASAEVALTPDVGPHPDSNGGADLSVTGDATPGACPEDWTLAWSDEFEGQAGAPADGKRWVYETGNGSGGWGNNELEYYRSENGVLDGDGKLVITAKKESASGFSYTSARMKTQGKVQWTYGRIEARIKLPTGKGIWPAFWMLGTDIENVSWPACGEIDVMENLGSEPTKVQGTIHGPGYSGGAGPSATYTLPGDARFADDFHVFAIEWEAGAIRWYVDGTLYSTKTPKDIGSGNTWVYDKPFFILLNLAVGGNWPGAPDATTVFPQTMVVDYVRVCQR